MSLRKLPEAQLARPNAYQWDAPAQALEQWVPRAAQADGGTISIYDVIGEDGWTGEGVSAKRVAGALRAIGGQPVTVSINSPGGDMFEGLAIYNLLREHPHQVTVRVMGLAASAASLIAMAGDRVEMGLGAFLMIHNSWGLVIGNQQDMREAAEVFAQFDTAMADIYAARSGGEASEIAVLMEAETWLPAEAAIAAGFADATFTAPAQNEPTARGLSARARLDATLARAGMPRLARRKLYRDAAVTPNADGTATPNAGFDEAAAARLMSTITG